MPGNVDIWLLQKVPIITFPASLVPWILIRYSPLVLFCHSPLSFPFIQQQWHSVSTVGTQKSHRVIELLRLEGTSGSHLVQTLCSSRDTFIMTWPNGFWIPPKRETPQPLWQPMPMFHNTQIRSASWCPYGTLCCSSFCPLLLVLALAPLKRAWLHPPCTLPYQYILIITHRKPCLL